MRILLCYGTRPELIKILPLIQAFSGRIDHKVLFTGQHSTLIDLEAAARRDLEIVISASNEGGNRLDQIFGAVLGANETIFDGITHVLVQGDTASALALALAAFHRRMPVIHLEAGLRTYDLENPYPEEMYRQSISRIASVHLCPTESSAANLRAERVRGRVIVCGNTVIDALAQYKQDEYSNEVVVTLHRRENLPLLERWFAVLSAVAETNRDLRFIFPVHPNPEVRGSVHLLRGLSVGDPLPYEDFIRLLARCRFAISDSGGIQEEASFLGRKVIVCRKTSERVEGLGTHAFLCGEPEYLPDLVRRVREEYRLNLACPYGDGRAAERITAFLESSMTVSEENVELPTGG